MQQSHNYTMQPKICLKSKTKNDQFFKLWNVFPADMPLVKHDPIVTTASTVSFIARVAPRDAL